MDLRVLREGFFTVETVPLRRSHLQQLHRLVTSTGKPRDSGQRLNEFCVLYEVTDG